MTDLKQRALEAATMYLDSTFGPDDFFGNDRLLAAMFLEFAADLDGWHALGSVSQTHIPDQCAACLYVLDLCKSARELREGKP